MSTEDAPDRPHVRQARVLRLIEDAMGAAGWRRSDLGDGVALFWPPRPLTEPVRIEVAAEVAETFEPEMLAQALIDRALARPAAQDDAEARFHRAGLAALMGDLLLVPEPAEPNPAAVAWCGRALPVADRSFGDLFLWQRARAITRH